MTSNTKFILYKQVKLTLIVINFRHIDEAIENYKVECNFCKTKVPPNDMREHLESCSPELMTESEQVACLHDNFLNYTHVGAEGWKCAARINILEDHLDKAKCDAYKCIM